MGGNKKKVHAPASSMGTSRQATCTPTTMSSFEYAVAATSSIYRLACYLFLRIIPGRIALKALPALYTMYLTAAWFNKPQSTTETAVVNKPKEDKLKLDGAPPRTLSEELLSLVLSYKAPRLATLVINTTIFLFTLEFVAFPYFDAATDVSFTRVGAVYPDAVKIAVRSPHVNQTDAFLQVVWRETHVLPGAEKSPWVDGPVVHLREEKDWTETIKLEGLWPGTAYEYRLADSDKLLLASPAHPIPFKTFPDPALSTGGILRFIVSSCTTPNFPYVPFQSRTIKGWDLLSDYLTTESTISSFMMFLGDFVYADVPLYFGDSQEAYRRLYRRNYASSSFRKVYERLPIFHAYDDHEIINNFAGLGNDSTPPFPNAADAFNLYNDAANYDGIDKQNYYDFRHGDVAFFVMDTRRYRSELTEDLTTRTMLGDSQLTALYAWLGKVNSTSTFKFVISSCPFTELWQMDAQVDSWAAYTHEKATLLDAMHSVPNVVVLSGDRHEFAVIEFNGKEDWHHKVLEISTSPLSMFWIPFYRSLKLNTVDTVKRSIVGTKTVVIPSEVEGEPGVEEVVAEVIEYEVPREKVISYVPEGNFKWSAITVNTTDLTAPRLSLELMSDGKQAFTYEVSGVPVPLQATTALGAFVPGSIKNILDKLGLNPGAWF